MAEDSRFSTSKSEKGCRVVFRRRGRGKKVVDEREGDRDDSLQYCICGSCQTLESSLAHCRYGACRILGSSLSSSFHQPVVEDRRRMGSHKQMGRWTVVAASSSSSSHITCDSEFNSLVNVCAEYDGTLAVIGRRS